MALNSPDQTNAQLIFVMQNATSTAEFAKNQQWRVTHYALLISAAAVAIVKFDWFGQMFAERMFLATIVSAAAIFSVVVTFHSHDAQCWARRRVKQSTTHLSDALIEALDLPEKFDSPQHFNWYAYFLAFMTAVGAILSIWIIFLS